MDLIGLSKLDQTWQITLILNIIHRFCFYFCNWFQVEFKGKWKIK
jgi:hypothetical protein